MLTEKKYRAKSNEYGDLIKGSNDPGRIRELQDSKDSFSSLADNEKWLANNFDKMVQAPAEEKPGREVRGQQSMGRPVAGILLDGLARPDNTLFMAPERETGRGQACRPYEEQAVEGA